MKSARKDRDSSIPWNLQTFSPGIGPSSCENTRLTATEYLSHLNFRKECLWHACLACSPIRPHLVCIPPLKEGRLEVLNHIRKCWPGCSMGSIQICYIGPLLKEWTQARDGHLSAGNTSVETLSMQQLRSSVTCLHVYTEQGHDMLPMDAVIQTFQDTSALSFNPSPATGGWRLKSGSHAGPRCVAGKQTRG